MNSPITQQQHPVPQNHQQQPRRRGTMKMSKRVTFSENSQMSSWPTFSVTWKIILATYYIIPASNSNSWRWRIYTRFCGHGFNSREENKLSFSVLKNTSVRSSRESTSVESARCSWPWIWSNDYSSASIVPIQRGSRMCQDYTLDGRWVERIRTLCCCNEMCSCRRRRRRRRLLQVAELADSKSIKYALSPLSPSLQQSMRCNIDTIMRGCSHVEPGQSL